MTFALIDVPRCLNVDASYVGSPRVPATITGPSTMWSEAVVGGGTRAFRKQVVQECLDTVAVLRSYREPLEGETWLTPAASERRMLAQVNAIIALGPDALEQVTALSVDAEVPDPGRVFGALLVLGCVEGGRWIERARDVFIATALRNAAEASAAIEALGLSPNTDVGRLLAPLLDDDRPRVRASALRVLSFRGALSERQWNNAMRDQDLAVVAAALFAPLHGYDRNACERALQPVWARDDSEAMARLAMRAGFSLDLDSVHVRAHEIARKDPSWAGAAHLLALVDDLSDRRVRELLDGPHTLEGVRAAAVLGSLELVPDLIALLDRTDSLPEVGAAAGDALTTITGVDFGSANDATQALGLWSRHSARFRRDARYRHGQPWSLDVLLQLIRSGPGLRSIRQDLYFEMQAATHSRVPRFSAYDFVGVQIESLRHIERWLIDSPVRRHDVASGH